jgi:hypothetical protein
MPITDFRGFTMDAQPSVRVFTLNGIRSRSLQQSICLRQIGHRT